MYGIRHLSVIKRQWLLCLLLALIPVTGIRATTTDNKTPSVIDKWLNWADEQVQQIIEIPDEQRTYENTLGALDDIQARVDIETALPQFMAFVSTDAREREEGLAAQQAWDEWSINLGKNEDLYHAIRAYADTNPALTGEKARLLEFTLRDYHRQGMDLPGEEREELKEIQKELSRLSIEFEKNIRDDETVVMLNVDEMDGLSDEFINSLDRIGDMRLVSLDYPTYLEVMDKCRSGETRRKMWVARRRRGGLRNVEVLEKIIKLRAQEAHMLGYPNTAAYKMETRMAHDPETVEAFYSNLRPLVRKKSKLDYKELLDAKRAYTGLDDVTLYPWDYSFYFNMVRRDKYAVDDDLVKQYFPIENVIQGVFDTTATMYGLEYHDITDQAGTERRPLWHPDVKLYEVHDKATGKLLGELYFDPYPRENKYGHAAQWSLFPRKVWADGSISTPLAAVVCNFPKPTPGKPSLLKHDEVTTFFHEFGHAMHTLLSEATTARFSGTNTELDFVELPSQMFENWTWDKEVLSTFARHYETGEPIPSDLLNAMIAARNASSGIDTEFQIFLGMMDLAYHMDEDGVVDTTAVYMDTFNDVLLWKAVPHTYYQASFGHLTGYEAGYYGYLWSLAYASDMFRRFKKEGLLNPETGMEFRKKVLAKGGTEDGMDMLVDFLGRKPDLSAFLEHLGLSEDKGSQN